MTLDPKKLVSQLQQYDKAYADGNPLVSDQEYDYLKKKLLSVDPLNPYLKMVGSDTRGKKQELPYIMGSLDQVHEGEFALWVKRHSLQKEDMVLTEKLDGISCLVIYRNGKLAMSFSKGTGTTGADNYRNVIHIENIPKQINHSELAVRGEIIVRNSAFEQNYKDDYKTARAMVAGVLNRSSNDPAILRDFEFIAYEVVDGAGEQEKLEQLTFLSKLGFKTVRHRVVNASSLNDTILANELSSFRKDYDYELDGMVITANRLHKISRSSDSLNPAHSVKFKEVDEDSIVETTVVKVHWEISKSAWWKPRVEIEPVELFGTTVTYASGFNGRFIVDNGIGPGAKIRITKAGSVIPYIVEVTSKSTPQYPDGDYKWNESEVELEAYGDHPEVRFKQVLEFFKGVEIDGLKEASLRLALRRRGYHFADEVSMVLKMSRAHWKSILGINGEKIYDSLHSRFQDMDAAMLLGSLPFFGVGFGKRKAKKILENYTFEEFFYLDQSRIKKIPGFESKSAKKIVEGLMSARTFVTTLTMDNLLKIRTTTQSVPNTSQSLKGYSVVMTGFRDNLLEKYILDNGGNTSSSVSKTTTHLVTKSADSTSSKAQKAKQLGIEILTYEEFCSLIGYAPK